MDLFINGKYEENVDLKSLDGYYFQSCGDDQACSHDCSCDIYTYHKDCEIIIKNQSLFCIQHNEIIGELIELDKIYKKKSNFINNFQEHKNRMLYGRDDIHEESEKIC